MARSLSLHRLFARASMVVATGAVAFGCATGDGTEETQLPYDASTETGLDDTGAEDASIDLGVDSGGDGATDTGSGGCKTNADCAGDPKGKFCLVSTDGGKSFCVPCLPPPFDECGPGTFCNDTTYTCETGCKTTADCKPGGGDAGADGGADAADDAAETGAAETGVSLVCDSIKHRCVGCVADPDCPSGFLCDRPSGTCVPGCTTTHPCPTDKDCCSGSCVDTKKDAKHCGACGNSCPTPTNASAGCSAGVCGIGTCNSGYGDCNSSASDGCEVNLLANKDNCGACGTVCALANATAACTAGACTIATCNGGYDDCDKIASTGCETSLKTESNCGVCGKLCTIPNGTGSCSTGTCLVSGCSTGYGDCDGLPANGCESNVAGGTPGPGNTILNCGTCGTSCAVVNGTPICAAGSCKVGACTAPYADCNSTYSDGCESNTTIDTSNCGGCGKVCSSVGGTASCAASTCSIACTPGRGNCDGNAANGCEVDLTSDKNNCNACGAVCATSSSVTSTTCTPSGTTGSCAVAACASGAYDRDKLFSNGCECLADSVGNTCSAALDVGTIAIGPGTTTRTGNLAGDGDTDEDWYKIAFQTAADCNYSPSITLSTSDASAKMQVFTSCTGSSPTGFFTCGGGPEPANTNAGLDSWKFNFGGGCEEARPPPGADPTPATGSFITTPTTVWVRVYRAKPASSCYPYTLTIGN
ncbi:MAG: hypothetical protein HYV09_21015 [Deltaproteobacteria bacterium]|nr:hypothetical protein [Deltaproteobacteria bacterium]